MKNTKAIKPFWQAIILGAVAGMRTMSAPAAASHLLSKHSSGDLKHSSLKFMQSDITATIFKVLAVGELIGDKLPNAPNRIAAPGLIGRCVTASLAGASIYKAAGKNMIEGALLGGITALGTTYGCFYLRRWAGKKTGISDPYLGATEDALVIGTVCVLATQT